MYFFWLGDLILLSIFVCFLHWKFDIMIYLCTGNLTLLSICVFFFCIGDWYYYVQLIMYLCQYLPAIINSTSSFNSSSKPCKTLLALLTKAKDIVFRFILEYSSLKDFYRPLGNNNRSSNFYIEDFSKDDIFGLGWNFEISYRVMISSRILVSFRGVFFLKTIFLYGEIFLVPIILVLP